MTPHRLVLILLTLVWCVVLISFREWLTGYATYSFLRWNLALALMPLLWSTMAICAGGVVRVGFLGAWVLFFPNAPYVLTDLIHLTPKGGAAPPWYDLLLLLSCGGVGLLIGFISLQQVQQLATARWGAAIAWTGCVAVLFASGFGIYLGRFLRWNSWDLVLKPMAVLADVADRFIDPFSHPRTVGVTLGFGIFLTLAYALFTPMRGGIRIPLHRP